MDEAKNQINDMQHKEQKTTNQNNKKKESKKNEDSVSSPPDNFKRSNICIIEVPEGEEKEQEIGNIFEKIMKENFLNLVKEIRQASPGSTESPKLGGCKEAHPRYIIIKVPKVKDKERGV